MIYREVHHIYDFCYYNFRENALLINYSKRISTALEETKLLQDTRENDLHREELTTACDMMIVFDLYNQVTECAKSFCLSYSIKYHVIIVCVLGTLVFNAKLLVRIF